MSRFSIPDLDDHFVEGRTELWKSIYIQNDSAYDAQKGSMYVAGGGTDSDAYEKACDERAILEKIYKQMAGAEKWTAPQCAAIGNVVGGLLVSPWFEVEDKKHGKLLLLADDYTPLNEYTRYLVDEIAGVNDWRDFGMKPREVLAAAARILKQAGVPSWATFYDEQREGPFINYRPFVVRPLANKAQVGFD